MMVLYDIDTGPALPGPAGPHQPGPGTQGPGPRPSPGPPCTPSPGQVPAPMPGPGSPGPCPPGPRPSPAQALTPWSRPALSGSCVQVTESECEGFSFCASSAGAGMFVPAGCRGAAVAVRARCGRGAGV